MIGLARRLVGLPSLLAMASVGLGGLVAWQVSQSPEVPPPSASVAAASSDDGEVQSAPRPFEPRPLESYAGIEARPLFMPSRRPPPAGGGAAGGKSGHDTLMLAGVILTTSKRLAMIETKRTSGVVVVREGQIVEGWSVDKIDADRVVISLDDQVFELLLDDKLKAPRKEVRRTPRAQPLPQQPAPKAPAQPSPDEGAGDGAPQGEDSAPLEPVEEIGGAG